MKECPTFLRNRRIYDLMLPRCEHLGLWAWLCDANGTVLCGPRPLSTDDAASVAELQQHFSSLAAAAHALEDILPLPDGRWAIPLRFGRAGSGALIITATRHARPRAAASELAPILRWSFTDLCKAVKDDEALIQFGDKLTQSYEEIKLLFRLARLLSGTHQPNELLAMVCEEMRQVLPIEWLAMKFSEQAFGVPQLQGRLLLAGNAPTETQQLASRAEALLASNAKDEWKQLLTPDTSAIAALTGSDVLAELMTHDNKPVGVLMAGGSHDHDHGFTSDEMEFLHAAADFLGIFYGISARFSEHRAMFLGTLQALTTSIDAKDSYTRGHSDRVALLTRKLAQALGMDEQTVQTYYVTGLVHDVGKIGVPEAVLCKCGKLDDAEFDWIKRHPEIGYRILKDIPTMEPMLPGVLHHHERWDGRGYPHRLAGEQIPLMARLISIADSFDAMSSSRSYRAAMPRERIIAEIRRCSGTQFDPSLVEPFLSLDFTEFDRMLQPPPETKAAA